MIVIYMKRIVWNHVELTLPDNWEVTSEGGSTLNGVIVAAPPEKAKFEIYWRKTKGKNFVKQYDAYLKKLVKRGYMKKSRITCTVKSHKGYIDVLKGNTRVYTASWYCDETQRLFIAQLDGEEVSLQLFTRILNTVDCHPIRGDIVEWRLAGIGLKLYEDYFVYDRVFKIGFSYAYFMSRDKKVHVIQFAMPYYVYEQKKPYEDTRNRIIKRLIPRMTFLKLVKDEGFKLYEVRHRLIHRLVYGILIEKLVKCKKPEYVQETIIKTNRKRVEDGISIADNTLCVEW